MPASFSPPRRVSVEVDLATLCANYRKIVDAVKPACVMAVLKANAYGLGVQPIAAALAKSGVERFGVAEPHEALALSPLSLPVQILGSILPDELPAMVAADVVLPVTDLRAAQWIQDEGARQNRRVKVHFKIDTGMGRLGILLPEARKTINQAVRLPNLDPEGIYSHFPMACRAGEAYTQQQIDAFLALLHDLKADDISIPLRHMANSDASCNFPQTAKVPFNLVRTGIDLHGPFDTEGGGTLPLRQVLTLKTRLISVRHLPTGMSIGYGLTHRLACETSVGTISAGYADGLPLALSNRGHVLIRGVPCPILGRISMDYTTVALDQVPDAAVGDEVICLGGEGPQAISVKDWASLKGTHPYEILCSISNRVERRYV